MDGSVRELLRETEPASAQDDRAVITVPEARVAVDEAEPVIIVEESEIAADIEEPEVPVPARIGGIVLHDSRPLIDGPQIRTRAYGMDRNPGAVPSFMARLIRRGSGAFDLDLRSKVKK
jgi:hypothetical protein